MWNTVRERVFNYLRPHQVFGKSRLLGPLVPNHGIHGARVFGYRMQLDVSEHIQRLIYLGRYEPAETALLERRLESGMTFVDVGANVGYFSLLAASRVGPAGRVLAVEPSPVAYPRLERTMCENAIGQVETLQAALGASTGEMELFVHPVFEPRFKRRSLRTIYYNHSPSLIPVPGWQPVRVRVRRLDECLIAAGLDHVDLLKIDVEGYEPQVIAGAAQLLSEGRVGALLCEFNDPALRSAGSSAAELLDFLLHLGFRETESLQPADPGGVVNRFLVHRSRRGRA